MQGEHGGRELPEERPAAMLEARDLCKSYGGVPVLRPVSFRLEAGECLGVAGANGSGKSTLLGLLAQVRRPDGGRVLFRGRDTAGDRRFPRRVLGYVPQDGGLAPELRAGEQIALWRAACGLRGGVQEELKELLGLTPLLRRRIGELSGGMQRRVSIAMALSTGEEVLVMDEATAGLDEAYREGLMTWMEGFLARGGCAVWCTHAAGELERLCTSCLTIREGRARWGADLS